MNYVHYKEWDEIDYPFPSAGTVEVLEWVSNSSHTLLGMQSKRN